LNSLKKYKVQTLLNLDLNFVTSMVTFEMDVVGLSQGLENISVCLIVATDYNDHGRGIEIPHSKTDHCATIQIKFNVCTLNV